MARREKDSGNVNKVNAKTDAGPQTDSKYAKKSVISTGSDTSIKGKEIVGIRTNIERDFPKLGKSVDSKITKGIREGAKTRKAEAKFAKEVEEATAKATAHAAAQATEKASQRLMKMGKVSATIGVGASIIAGLNKGKGRQSNSQLYGQKGY